MLYVQEPEIIKRFKKCIEDICDEDMAIISSTVSECLKLFKIQYEDISNWMQSSSNQTEWFDCLAILAKEILVKEINKELPFGTSNGIYLTLLFFKAVAIKEDEQSINTMADYLEKFNRIGCQISKNCDEPIKFTNCMNLGSNFQIRVH